jgi:hypothetical protein
MLYSHLNKVSKMQENNCVTYNKNVIGFLRLYQTTDGLMAEKFPPRLNLLQCKLYLQ